ncbi:bifunctional riboflavin kinase/FAD synthetase [Candidatus Pelagibacter bacterium]|nr:bifunctional riboflavin kinase/FAD synthetase [Candidatus Pelagibacter bacterium]MDA9619031.1 bifunctional riboflavin kinase/FAD synthetase [Candidatus Pelagibacter bacterium]
MKTYNNLNLNQKHRSSVIAIGNFDGIHLGHQKVIIDAKKKARKNRLPFGLMTFEPVPVMFFNKKIKNHRINSLDQKKEQLKKLRLDFLIIIKFNKNFSSLSAEEFIKKIIHKRTSCRFLYVSKNFRFGFKRKGNIETLKKYEKQYNFKNVIVKPFKTKRKIISSTFIRKKIRKGKIEEVNKLLNRNWSIKGKVIKGQKRGRKIGFPTCNLRLNSYVIPRLGVYAVKVKTNNISKNGIANVGYRPTFNGQSLLLETNIFGINKNLYNKVITVGFKKFLRDEKKFKSFEYLKKQIKIDIKQAKK